MACQACGASAPTKQVSFSQNIGLIIIRFHRSISGQLCRSCIDSNFWTMTTISALFGWWGVISFFFNLFIVPSNIITYIGALGLPRGPAGPGPGSGYGQNPGGYGQNPGGYGPGPGPGPAGPGPGPGPGPGSYGS